MAESNAPSVTCPKCGAQVTYLKTLSEALMQKLRDEGYTDLPQQMCESCYQDMAGKVARGAVLMAEMKVREQKKMLIWKSRVALLRKARALMREKAFADAAISYEKYIRVLETVYDVPPGGLTPDHLKSTARTQELTVIASVYWDLFRIYDTSERYTQRMEQVGKKLAEFLPFTPLLPEIIRKAQAFEKTARKPQIVKGFLKAVGERKSKCFIATEAFQSPHAFALIPLRHFRDHCLLPFSLGNCLVELYYEKGPVWAEWVRHHPQVRKVLRLGLNIISRCIFWFFRVQSLWHLASYSLRR